MPESLKWDREKNEYEKPDGWEVGWKFVTRHRRPIISQFVQYPAWFGASSIGNRFAEVYARNCSAIIYTPGTLVKAMDPATGLQFESSYELRAFRYDLSFKIEEYAPAIHLSIEQEPTGPFRDLRQIKVAYYPPEVVHTSWNGRKIGVFQVWVLT